MASYSRPGVFINEVPLPQLVALADNGQARGAFLGAFAQGPTAEPVLIQSWYDFGKTFGSLSDSYPATWSIYSFFANGGRSAYIKRVVGAGATAASVTLRDRAGTPLSTLRVTAKSAGAWGNALKAEVTAASTTTFNLIISDANGILEQFTDLSMSTTNSRYCVAYVNSASYYVTLTNLTSGTAAPANMPEIAGEKTFASGADGSAPTRASYQTALATFDAITNPLIMINADASYAFASGGETGARAAKVLLDTDVTAYADARGDVFALIDPPAGSTPAEAITYAIDGCGAVDGGNAAIYYPWVVIPDLLKSAPGATRVVGPAAIAAGKYLETDASRGVFKTPAGFGTKINSAVALERSLTNTELDNLNAASKPVNAIRNVPGGGIVIMGGRTLNNSTGERYINVRRSMIFLKKEITDRSSFAVFENNSEILWNQLRTAIGNFLRNYWSQGGLRGASPEQAYYVRCDATNNTPTDILNGRVNIEVGVAVEYPAEFVVISIGQITGSASA
jgi:phage tail sheath protein FI